MKSVLLFAIALGLTTSGSQAADAVAAPLQAKLEAQTGTVLVNQGEQFVELGTGTLLKPGDRVMAMEKSSALVRYFDGCDVEVKNGDVFTIDENLPCPCLDFGKEKGPVATLVESTGDIALRSSRSAYTAISAGQTLRVGEEVRVGRESKGVFEFRDGCRQDVAETNQDYRVPDQSPCLCAALVFDHVAPAEGTLAIKRGVLIPTALVAACLAVDNDDGNVNCKDEQASP